MAFDEKLADRIRRRLGKRAGVTEKRMFGGIAFLLRGNMCCGVHGKDLIVRLDGAATEAALAAPHTRRFDLTGRPMKGWILVQPEGLATDDALGKWLTTSVKYAEALPPK
jgi:hypothetical protein